MVLVMPDNSMLQDGQTQQSSDKGGFIIDSQTAEIIRKQKGWLFVHATMIN